MLRKEFFIDARFVIIAFEVGGCGELDEVLITDLVLGQQDKVMIDIAPATGGFLFEAAAGGDINFAADNRLDPLLARHLIKINRAIENAVIGESERGKFQLVRSVHELVQTARPIEERILRMQMQMNKLFMIANG